MPKRKSGLLGPLVFALVLAGLFSSGTAAVISRHEGGNAPDVSGSLAAFRACVISRESGGDPQVWNRQGYPYWGLYQFGYALWTANGGSPASWGHADAGTQTRIFYAVMSHYRGCANWFYSDSCAFPANGCG